MQTIYKESRLICRELHKESWANLLGFPFLPLGVLLKMALRWSEGSAPLVYRVLGNSVHRWCSALAFALMVRGLIRAMRTQLAGTLSALAAQTETKLDDKLIETVIREMDQPLLYSTMGFLLGIRGARISLNASTINGVRAVALLGFCWRFSELVRGLSEVAASEFVSDPSRSAVAIQPFVRLSQGFALVISALVAGHRIGMHAGLVRIPIS